MKGCLRRRLIVGSPQSLLVCAVVLATLHPAVAFARPDYGYEPEPLDGWRQSVIAMLTGERPDPLATSIPTTFSGLSGHVGVAVRNLATGETLAYNGDEFFPSASLYKLAVMYEVFRQEQAHHLSFDEALTIQDGDVSEATDEDTLSAGDTVTIGNALELMIEASSNVAAYALADRVGWEQINTSLASLSLNRTRLPVGSWKSQVTDWRTDESSTSPNDMLTFFQRLANQQLVSADASQAMLTLLLNQRVNDRIPANLPPGTGVAHKTGNLSGVVNDAGIVYGPTASFVVVFLGQDVDDGIATTAEAQVARAIYDQFNPSPAPT